MLGLAQTKLPWSSTLKGTAPHLLLGKAQEPDRQRLLAFPTSLLYSLLMMKNTTIDINITTDIMANTTHNADTEGIFNLCIIINFK
jgi:hypothetical protein